MTASIQREPQHTNDVFSATEKQWALTSLLQDIQDRTGYTFSPTNMKYFKGLLCGYSINQIVEILDANKGTVKTAVGKYISPAVREFLEIEDIKAFTDIPELLKDYRRRTINLPIVETFYGRHRELTDLTHAVESKHCQFIMLHGRGGVGKTHLISQWAKESEKHFFCCIRLDMREERTFDQLIWDIMQYLPLYSKTNMPTGTGNQITWLLSALTKYRCLIIFDDIHHLFHPETAKSDHDYEEIDDKIKTSCETLFCRLATNTHKSCIVAIGWYKPPGFDRFERPQVDNDDRGRSSIQYLQLEGLQFEDAQHILRDYGLIEDIDCWKELVKNYRGFPYSLKLVSKYISGFIYEKDVQKFLLDNTFYLGKSKTLIFEQFRLLPPRCQFLLFIISQQGMISVSDLQAHLDEYALSWSTSDVGEVLETLHEVGFIESHDRKISPPPDITKCVLKDCKSLLPRLLEKLAP